MQNGTIFSTKQELIDAYKALIYKNENEDITGDIHQLSGLHIIETLWDKISNSTIDTNSTDFQSDLDSGSLTPTAFYKFDYQTIHKLPNSSDIHTGVTETILLQATDVDKVSPVAFSLNNPFDILYYDADDRLAEDGSTPRPGYVYRRIDTQNNVDTPFDFREYSINLYDVDYSAIPTYAAGTFTQGDIVINPSNYVAICADDHTGTSTYDGTKFIDIIDTTRFTKTTKTSSFNIAGVSLDVITSTPTKVKVLDGTFRNFKMEPSTNKTVAFLGGTYENIYLTEGVIDVLFQGSCSSIFTSNTLITAVFDSCNYIDFKEQKLINEFYFYGVSNVDIKLGCNRGSLRNGNDLFIDSYATNYHFENCNQIVLGYDSDFTYIKSSSSLEIGDSVDRIYAYNSAENIIRKNCSDIELISSDNNIIESGTNVCKLENSSNSNYIGIGCANIDLIEGIANYIGNFSTVTATAGGFSYNTVGISSSVTASGTNTEGNVVGNQSNVTFSVPAQNNIIGNNSLSITLQGGGSYSATYGNTIGNKCSNITIGGTNNQIGNGCESIVCSDTTVGLHRCTFVPGVKNKTFTKVGTFAYFVSLHFITEEDEATTYETGSSWQTTLHGTVIFSEYDSPLERNRYITLGEQNELISVQPSTIPIIASSSSTTIDFQQDLNRIIQLNVNVSTTLSIIGLISNYDFYINITDKDGSGLTITVDGKIYTLSNGLDANYSLRLRQANFDSGLVIIQDFIEL